MSNKYNIIATKLVNSIAEDISMLNKIENATHKINTAKTEYTARKWRHKRAGHLAAISRSL